MSVESSICLLEELNAINKGNVKKCAPAITGGVFTPSVVFCNTNLQQRLQDAGITFQFNQLQTE